MKKNRKTQPQNQSQKFENLPKESKESHQFGFYAEKYCMIFLWLKGYKILKHRFKSYFGEIDIIAFKNNQVVFVEVKARTSAFNVESVIGGKQINRIKRSSEYFMAKNSALQNYRIRYDFIEVKPWFSFLLKVKHRTNFIS